jgi:integrase
MADPRRRPEGVVTRHARRCSSGAGGRCSCRPRYQAQVYSPPERRTIRRTFATVAEARAWRTQAKAALARGRLAAATSATLSEAAEEWLEAARVGVVRTRSGEPYKPSALRAYEEALRAKVLPALARRRLASIARADVQELVDRLVARGLAPSTVRNAVLPLRAIYRRAEARQQVLENPTLGLSLPALRARRERVARPSEARALLAALPHTDRPLWACALYAGLRRGELQALRLCDVDLEAQVIRVERSFDSRAGPIEPKSRAGRRRVPLCAPLRGYLAGLAEERAPEALMFGRSDELPFAPGPLARRARTSWARADIAPLTLHQCRHTYAAYMIAAGVSAKALSSYMGHSSITVTLDRYGHLLPGAEREAAGLLGAYLDSQNPDP